MELREFGRWAGELRIIITPRQCLDKLSRVGPAAYRKREQSATAMALILSFPPDRPREGGRCGISSWQLQFPRPEERIGCGGLP
jgi:hypothetical protein